MDNIKVYRAYWFDEKGNKKYLNKGKLYLKRAHCKNGAYCHYCDWASIGEQAKIYIEECDLVPTGVDQIGVCDRTSRWSFDIEWRDNNDKN